MLRLLLHERNLPLRSPLHTAHGRINQRRVLVLELQDAASNIGLGEAAPLPAWGGEDPVSCREALDLALPHIPRVVESLLYEDLSDALLGPLEQILGKTPCARCCVEGAILDLIAQRRDLPLASILRLDVGEPLMLPVTAILSGSEIQSLGEAAARLVARGWRTIQWEATGDWRTDLAVAQALRERIGSEVNLRIDVDAAWDRDSARAFLTAAKELRLEFVEQPLAADDLQGMSALRRLGSAPIAVDQSIRSAGDVGRVISAQAADLVVLKPMALGGWRPTRQAAELARSMETEVVINSFVEGSIGRAYASHMAWALGLGTRALGLATGVLLARDLTFAPLRPQAGLMPLRPGSGLGIGDLIQELELPDPPVE